MWCHRYCCATPPLTCWEWANRSSYIVDVPGTLKAFWLVFRVLQFQFHGQHSLLTTCSFRGSMKQNIRDEHKKPRGVQQSLWVGLNTGTYFSPAFSLHWQLMISVKLFYVHYLDPFVLFLLLPFMLTAQKGSSHCLATKYKPGHHQSICCKVWKRGFNRLYLTYNPLGVITQTWTRVYPGYKGVMAWEIPQGDSPGFSWVLT